MNWRPEVVSLKSMDGRTYVRTDGWTDTWDPLY